MIREKINPLLSEASIKHLEASQPSENISKDLYMDIYLGTYTVPVGSNYFTKKTHIIAADL